MRGVVLGMAALLAVAGCGDEPLPAGATEYAYDPVCDLGTITVDDETYEVVAVDEVGDHAPAPDPTLGPYLMDGTLERFDDGTARWTGNGYAVSFDSGTNEGMYQVC
jgi:hypothetical protein